ncbi:MAG: hypothetical protein KAI40_02710 [Desulfobacterales bacterium]|nr:hypothetical protein [Desulfobacterales bacterium]
MAQKVTLSIPDMLYEKLSKWRESFNLSKMFQDALLEAIQKKEEFQKRIKQDFDMSEIIERLKIEKFESEKNYLEMGLHKGLEWAKRAHYEDLVYAVGFEETHNIIKDNKFNYYFNEIFNSDHLINFSQENLNQYAKKFLDGWCKGVSDFYNEVVEKLS